MKTQLTITVTDNQCTISLTTPTGTEYKNSYNRDQMDVGCNVNEIDDLLNHATGTMEAVKMFSMLENLEVYQMMIAIQDLFSDPDRLKEYEEKWGVTK